VSAILLTNKGRARPFFSPIEALKPTMKFCVLLKNTSPKQEKRWRNTYFSNEKQRQLVASSGADDDGTAQFLSGSAPIALPGRARGNMRENKLIAAHAVIMVITKAKKNPTTTAAHARNIHIIKRQLAHALREQEKR
jgi:hypothetical protein